MIFVAQRVLKYTPKGSEETVVFKPGDVIPDFENWNVVARKAHLNLEYVKEMSPEELKESPAGKIKATKKYKHTLPSPVKSAEKVEEVQLAKTEAHSEEEIFYTCPRCIGKKFNTPKALSTHVTLAHTKKG